VGYKGAEDWNCVTMHRDKEMSKVCIRNEEGEMEE
jgi:hypothetical protein